MDPINGISFSLAIKNQWNEKAPRIILLSSENVELKHEKKLQPDKVFVKSLSLPRDLQEYFDKELSSFVRSKATTQNLNKHLVKSVFIVEDDVNILELFLVVFTDKKDVVVFNEVTKWDPFERIAQLMPDLIICDIHVPNVDTKSLLLKIKTSEELREIPVVFFSGDPEQPIATELIRCGALAVLDKTIILTSMFDELEKLGIELHTSA
jgi:CheY-like chemotaxis protein